MKTNVPTGDWWESGLFKSEADYKEFLARTRKKLAVPERLRRIKNCPKKQGTPLYHDQELQLKAKPEKRHRLEGDKDRPHDLKNHVRLQFKNLKKIRRPNTDKKEKRQRKLEGPEPPPEMPRWLREAVEEMGGHGQRLLIQKNLKKSDVKSGQNRISMPMLQLRGPDDFLTGEELLEVSRRMEDNNNRIKGLNVTFVEPGLRTSVLSLRKWDIGSGISYVFAGKLKDFVKRNGLKAGETVQIRFFRCRDGNPRFALVNLTAETASSSSSASSSVVTAEENQATNV